MASGSWATETTASAAADDSADEDDDDDDNDDDDDVETTKAGGGGRRREDEDVCGAKKAEDPRGSTTTPQLRTNATARIPRRWMMPTMVWDYSWKFLSQLFRAQLYDACSCYRPSEVKTTTYLSTLDNT